MPTLIAVPMYTKEACEYSEFYGSSLILSYILKGLMTNVQIKIFESVIHR